MAQQQCLAAAPEAQLVELLDSMTVMTVIMMMPRKGSRFMFSHPWGPTMQPCAPKGQGSLFNMGCTKAEGFGAAIYNGA
eukprot:1150689-Pelagomonas_calceolata.AAC.5